jgi:cytochrome c2
MKRLLLITFTLAAFAVACNRGEQAQTATTSPAPAVATDVTPGKQLIVQYGCTVCHVIPGIDGPQGSLGPTLAGIATRPMLSNGTVQNTPANLARFVQTPQALNPQSSMPPIGLSDADAEAIAAYLQTLR